MSDDPRSKDIDFECQVERQVSVEAEAKYVSTLYHYHGTVAKVVDADTLDLHLDLGFKLTHEIRVRLVGVDAWETRGEERPKGREAAFRVFELCGPGTEVYVKTQKDRKGKYGRYLAEIILPREGWQSLGDILVREGHAVPKAF